MNSSSKAAKQPPASPAVVVAPVSPILPRAALPQVFRIAVAGWVVLAFALAAAELYGRVRPLVALVLATAVLAPVLAWRRSAALRAWSSGLDLRMPILLHVVRVGFGTLFLVELAAGTLPEYLALKAGIGDIIVGLLALGAALAASRPLTPGRRWLVLGWNTLGLVDIVSVVATAQYGFLVLHDAQIASVLGRLPYALLPTVVVPLVVLSHLLVFQRVWAVRVPSMPTS